MPVLIAIKFNHMLFSGQKNNALNVARLFNIKPIQPASFTEIVEHSFCPKNRYVESIQVLNYPIARIGK